MPRRGLVPAIASSRTHRPERKSAAHQNCPLTPRSREPDLLASLAPSSLLEKAARRAGGPFMMECVSADATVAAGFWDLSLPFKELPALLYSGLLFPLSPAYQVWISAVHISPYPQP